MRDKIGTIFSGRKFIEAVARSEGGGAYVFDLKCSRSPTRIYGLERRMSFKRRAVSLGPFGMYAYPLSTTSLATDDIQELVSQLRSINMVRVEWNVRFDHADLAYALKDAGFEMIQRSGRVLFLDRSYGETFKIFTASARNQVRQAERRGLVVRIANSQADLDSFYEIYRALFDQRDQWSFMYKKALVEDMLADGRDGLLLVAEVSGLMVGGLALLCDGPSLYYWIGAIDYRFKSYFPYYAMVNSAIREAYLRGLTSFNMGASPNPSIEQFKSFWGTRVVPYWVFHWNNPIWTQVSRMRRLFAW